MQLGIDVTVHAHQILVGVVSSVSEIKLAYESIKVEKLNRSESAQKICASRG